MVLPVVQIKFITVVSGIPRSGTSLLMQMLVAGGMPALTDNLRPPDENNPRGYFEFEPVKRLHKDQTWVASAEGRAIKIIYLLLRELPTDGRFQYRVICMDRPGAEVIASQRRMLERQGKKSADESALLNSYKEQLSQVEDWLAARSCFRVTKVHYHRILEKPGEVAREVNAFLDGCLDIQAMAAAVDPALCHQRVGGRDRPDPTR